MPTTQSHVPVARLTPVQWAICITASIGFAFDSYVLLMLPLIVRPALQELLRVGPADPHINQWVGYLFYWPAVAGGIFGLLGGYLTDLFGRRRVLVWSILLYAIAGVAAGYSTSVYQLLFWRCCMFVGVCVEFVAAVAWLAELFQNPRQREAVVGYTQAFGSLGGLMVTAAYYLVVTYADALPLVRGGHEAWRYTLMSGIVPAIPELFRPEFSRTTIVTTIMMACAFAAAFGAIQQVPRIVPGLAEVRAMPRAAQEQTVSAVQSFQEFGGLAGRLLLAFLAVRIVSRRRLLHVFQIPGLILLPLVFLFPATSSLVMLEWGIFLVGLLTIAQFSYWGNYLPRVYPTYLRGTGESFAANVGGRMIGTSAALITTSLVASMPGATPAGRLAHAAALVGTAAYAIGFIASFALPEPKREGTRDPGRGTRDEGLRRLSRTVRARRKRRMDAD
ncbi:MAG: MFS transporter [Acidobacteria bacterium]|nr:MAG: MFS transporter [Acidobacteriota bacterium]